MNFIDTHIHLQDYKSKSAPQIIAEAAALGIEKFVCAATSEQDWESVAILAEQFPAAVIPAFGLHPWYIGEASSDWATRLQTYLERFPDALLGETGLDRIKSPSLEPQLSIFKIQIDLARDLNRALIVHAVKADEWLQNLWDKMPPRFVMHSFSGSPELVRQALKAGAYISFSNSVLRSKYVDVLLQEVPDDKLLFETDGPYQGPLKGQETPSSSLISLIAAGAEAKGVEPSVLATKVYHNSQRFINGK